MFNRKDKGVIGPWEVVIVVIALALIGLVVWRVTSTTEEATDIDTETTINTDNDSTELQVATIPGINVDYVLNSYTENLIFEDKGDGLVGVGSTLVTDYIRTNYPEAEYACENTLYFLNTQTKTETLPADTETEPDSPWNQTQVNLSIAEGRAIEINDSKDYLFASGGVEPCEIYAGNGQVPDDPQLATLMATERESGMAGLISAIGQALR